MRNGFAIPILIQTYYLASACDACVVVMMDATNTHNPLQCCSDLLRVKGDRVLWFGLELQHCCNAPLQEHRWQTSNEEEGLLACMVETLSTAVGAVCNHNACHMHAHDCWVLTFALAASVRQEVLARAGATTELSTSSSMLGTSWTGWISTLPTVGPGGGAIASSEVVIRLRVTQGAAVDQKNQANCLSPPGAGSAQPVSVLTERTLLQLLIPKKRAMISPPI
jgi:hypothetical protein